MPNHYQKNITDRLPKMKTSVYTSKNNTNLNRDDYFRQMKETYEYKRVVDLTTGELTIWYMRPDDVGIKVTTSNSEGSCTIVIQHFSLGKEEKREFHEFHPLGFSDSVTAHLLTEEDLAEQRRLITQEQERKDALRLAHYSKPKTCEGVHKCKYCISEKSERERMSQGGLGTYT
jgi:hypothetical protein